MNLAELRRRRTELINQARALLDTADGEQRALSAEEETAYNGLETQIRAINADIQRRETLEEMGGAPAAGVAGESGQRGAPAHHQRRTPDTPNGVFMRYVRTGDEGALREVRASNDTSMNITTAADGGNAVPVGHYQGIIARRDEAMLAPKLGVQNIPGKGTTVNVPVDAEDDGEFVTTSEQNDAHSNNFDRDAAALGTVAMTLVKKTKKIELTDELLEDEDSNLMGFIENFVGRGMAKTHNSMLLTEVLANGTAALTLDAAADIGAGEIPELYYKLPEEYAEDENVAWLMKRATEGTVRSKTGDGFLFSPNPAGDALQQTLWGRPVHNTAYAGAVQASGKSLIFGNFFYVGKREGASITFIRDNITVDGMVILKYNFRAVYKVLQAEAVLYASHPSA